MLKNSQDIDDMFGPLVGWLVGWPVGWLAQLCAYLVSFARHRAGGNFCAAAAALPLPGRAHLDASRQLKPSPSGQVGWLVG